MENNQEQIEEQPQEQEQPQGLGFNSEDVIAPGSLDFNFEL